MLKYDDEESKEIETEQKMIDTNQKVRFATMFISPSSTLPDHRIWLFNFRFDT